MRSPSTKPEAIATSPSASSPRNAGPSENNIVVRSASLLGRSISRNWPARPMYVQRERAAFSRKPASSSSRESQAASTPATSHNHSSGSLFGTSNSTFRSINPVSIFAASKSGCRKARCQETGICSHRPDFDIFKNPRELADSFLTVVAAADQLRDHRVVEWRDRVTFLGAGLDAPFLVRGRNGRACRRSAGSPSPGPRRTTAPRSRGR